MSITYYFACEFTKSKVSTSPANAPTIDIVDIANPSGALLVSGGAPTVMSNMAGVYVYAYTTSTLTYRPVGLFTTTDTTVDLQQIPSYPQIVLDANNNVLSSPQTQVDLTSTSIASTVDGVWDEPLTAATHNVGNSSGKRLRQLSAQFIWSGTAQGGGTNYITLDSGASSMDDIYDPSLIFIDTGTGMGQSREVFQYDGSTRRAWVNRNWRTAPDNTSTFQIYSFSGDGHTNEGPCAGGTANTITLNRNASTVDNFYVGQVVVLVSGTGDDQADRIISYNGTTKVATVDHDWETIPVSNDTVYAIYGTAQMDSAYIENATWDATMANHLTAGTTGDKLNNAGSSSDPLSNSVPGSYVSGTAGYTLGHLNDNSVTVVAAVQSGQINVYRGTTWDIDLIVGNIVGASKVYFTIKSSLSDSDSSAVLQIEKSSGLVVLNGSSSVTTGDGSLVVNDASTGSITISLKPSSSSQIKPEVGLSYDVKSIVAGVVSTVADGRGKLNVISDITRKYS